MKLHTVVVTFNRLELTRITIESYLETVTVPHTLCVVDNASSQEMRDWLLLNESDYDLVLLDENRYPGYACNRGWERAADDADFLQRADNDFVFLPGWCEEVERHFRRPLLGQLGLRTADEELHVRSNVGGNCIIRRVLWDGGLRYNETPWPDLPPGYSEDSYFSPEVVRMGYNWARVKQPCIRSLASGDWSDPYYQRSYGDRGIGPKPHDPTVSSVE